MTLVFPLVSLKGKAHHPQPLAKSCLPPTLIFPSFSSTPLPPFFFIFLLRCLEMKSMFHMLHYISIIQLVLKSTTLIIYCASCKWSIHMEPSFSTFLMLFPGYKLQENISYLKEGNALNECCEVSYTKEDTQSLLENRDCSLGWEMCGARGFWHPLGCDRSCSLVEPPFHQNSHCTQQNACPSTNLIYRENHTWCALKVPSDFEKFAFRSPGGGGTATLVTQNPFQQVICPHQKEDLRFSTLTH